MREYILGSLAIAFLLAQTNVVQGSDVLGCYWGTWANYRSGDGKFQPENIDPTLCTHLYYAFFGIEANGTIKSLDPWLDNGLHTIAKAVALKKSNPNLKLMASIGGWNEGSQKYSAMASSSATRGNFITSAVQFLVENGFDGLDLDWEYPAQRDGSPDDRANFVTLMAELSVALKVNNLLLTVAVAASESSASISYDIPSFSQYVDLINVMTYDFFGSWDNTTGINAPLQGTEKGLNVKASVEYWISSGAPPHKLVLGLPAYGRTFTLANSDQYTLGSAAIGAGNAGPYTGEAGFLGYYEICENLKAGWTRVWDADQSVPYAYNGNQWVGYDDTESIALKVNYLKSQNLAGAMVWSIESDDFRGKCGESFPLLKAIRAGLSAR